MVGDAGDEHEEAGMYDVDPTTTFSSPNIGDDHQASEYYTETIGQDELSQMLRKFDKDHKSKKEYKKFMCMVNYFSL
jgi:hypothetical protein